ncbi:MAG TPA: prepilin-type N-terminal cleavage/methylation domain-containing protein [Gemmataceae bacterium]|jgi:hypothetical protein|nr:prepilin-type N-terminal cleavage/methylation domain-containing protein [Gemmataceae bacterium]
MRIRSHARSVRRSAFTLVEMLVATALVMMIMLIISQALAAASKTTSALRTAGVLQERNRTAITLMRKDLGGDKFGPPYGSARGGPRLSDQRLDQSGWTPANSGYFEMRQLGEGPAGNLASILEPFANARTDGEGITSTRAVNHKMRFTVRLPDGPQTDLFAAQFLSTFTADSRVNSFINAQSIMYTRWAEVVYWLEPTVGEFASGGLQLYSLRRRIRLLPPTSVDYNNLPLAQAMQLVGSYYVSYPNVPKYPDVIAPIIVTPNPIPAQPPQFVTVRLPGPEALNNPDVDWTPTYVDNTKPPQYVQRMSAIPHPYLIVAGVPTTGEDVVLTDVLSFDIKLAWFNNATFNTVVQNSSPPPAIFATGNMDEPFSDIYWNSVLMPGQGRVFDTGLRTILGDPRFAPIDPADADQMTSFLTPSAGTVPNRINVRAIQIKIRIYDPRAEQARQVTIVQEV